MTHLQAGNELNGSGASQRASIVAEIQRSLGPKRVFDMGSRQGFLVEALRDAGIEAWSVDISAQPAQQIGGPYDLVTCLDVVGYMSRDEATEAIRQITAS